jgi:hypothetical protein
MASKTLGTVAILIICILMFPIAVGILGGAFGIVMGVFGAVFGVFFGLLGGVFGAIFGFFGWLFDNFFGWGHHFHFFNMNFWSVLFLVVIVVLLMKNKNSPRGS